MGFKTIKGKPPSNSALAAYRHVYKFIFCRDVSHGLSTGSRTIMFFKCKENHVWCFYAGESGLKLSHSKNKLEAFYLEVDGVVLRIQSSSK